MISVESLIGLFFFLCSSFVQSGRIFVTSTCDLFVAETSASTSTAILEQDVNFAAYTNTHGLNFSQQSPGEGGGRESTLLKSDLSPSPSSSSSLLPPSSFRLTPPPPASQHPPLTVFKMSKVTVVGSVSSRCCAVKTFVRHYDAVVTRDPVLALSGMAALFCYG